MGLPKGNSLHKNASYDIYTMGHKKGANLFLTLSKINRF